LKAPAPALDHVTVPVGEFPLTVALQLVTVPIPSGAAMHRIVVGSCSTTPKEVLETDDEVNSDTSPASMPNVAEQRTLPLTEFNETGVTRPLCSTGSLPFSDKSCALICPHPCPATRLGKGILTVKSTVPTAPCVVSSASSKQSATTAVPEWTVGKERY